MSVIVSCLENLKQQALITQDNKYPIQGVRMNSKVKAGSIWVASNGERFFVMTKSRKDDLVWVVYRKENSFDTYSCLEPAFLQRFTEFNNQPGSN